MRYFTYIAEQAFKTSPSGERLFYHGTPWSRPYIIPDPATEQKLYTKQVWSLRIMLGGMLLGQPFLFALVPKMLWNPYWFLAYLVGMCFAIKTVWWILFVRDLRRLKRTEARLQLASFYGQVAQRHSYGALTLGLLGSLLFVLAGLFFMVSGLNYVISMLAVVFFGMCALAWGDALHLKSKSNTSAKLADKDQTG